MNKIKTSIEPINNKGYPNGYWERYLDDVLWFKKFFINNGMPNGYEEKYKLGVINDRIQIDDSNLTLAFNL